MCALMLQVLLQVFLILLTCCGHLYLVEYSLRLNVKTVILIRTLYLESPRENKKEVDASSSDEQTSRQSQKVSSRMSASCPCPTETDGMNNHQPESEQEVVTKEDCPGENDVVIDASPVTGSFQNTTSDFDAPSSQGTCKAFESIPSFFCYVHNYS